MKMSFETTLEERIFLKRISDLARPLSKFISENVDKNLIIIVSRDKIKIKDHKVKGAL